MQDHPTCAGLLFVVGAFVWLAAVGCRHVALPPPYDITVTTTTDAGPITVVSR
jgi:hypothetical protein